MYRRILLRNWPKALRQAAAVALLMVVWTGQIGEAKSNDAPTVAAFTNFLANGDYKNANFYLQSGLIRGGNVNTGQIFYDIYHKVYRERKARALPHLATLYDYLSRLRPFDLNARYKCDSAREQTKLCVLVNDLALGMPIAVFQFFTKRGLELNRTFDGILPATFDVVDQLGMTYSLTDISALSQLGMAFGSDNFEPVRLANYAHHSDGYSRKHKFARQLTMPHNYLSINSFNFMDILIVAIANDVSHGSKARMSLRSNLLCQYVVHAARSYRPSFDYLRYVLANRQSFRASEIGKRIKVRNSTAEPFPSACVALVAGMAQNHGRLDRVVSYFGAQGDVDTARWLLALRSAVAPRQATPQGNTNAAVDQSGNGGSMAPAVLNTNPPE